MIKSRFYFIQRGMRTATVFLQHGADEHGDSYFHN